MEWNGQEFLIHQVFKHVRLHTAEKRKSKLTFFILFIGTVLIVIGAILVGGFGVVREPNHSLEDLIRLYHRPAFIAYFSILEFFTLIMLMATHYIEYRVNQVERGALPESKLIKMESIPELKMKLGVR